MVTHESSSEYLLQYDHTQQDTSPKYWQKFPTDLSRHSYEYIQTENLACTSYVKWKKQNEKKNNNNNNKMLLCLRLFKQSAKAT